MLKLYFEEYFPKLPCDWADKTIERNRSAEKMRDIREFLCRRCRYYWWKGQYETEEQFAAVMDKALNKRHDSNAVYKLEDEWVLLKARMDKCPTVEKCVELVRKAMFPRQYSQFGNFFVSTFMKRESIKRYNYTSAIVAAVYKVYMSRPREMDSFSSVLRPSMDIIVRWYAGLCAQPQHIPEYCDGILYYSPENNAPEAIEPLLDFNNYYLCKGGMQFDTSEWERYMQFRQDEKELGKQYKMRGINEDVNDDYEQALRDLQDSYREAEAEAKAEAEREKNEIVWEWINSDYAEKKFEEQELTLTRRLYDDFFNYAPLMKDHEKEGEPIMIERLAAFTEVVDDPRMTQETISRCRSFKRVAELLMFLYKEAFTENMREYLTFIAAAICAKESIRHHKVLAYLVRMHKYYFSSLFEEDLIEDVFEPFNLTGSGLCLFKRDFFKLYSSDNDERADLYATRCEYAEAERFGVLKLKKPVEIWSRGRVPENID